MTLLNEVVFGQCSDVYHYLLNKIRYIKRNPKDSTEKYNIQKDLSDIDNSMQVLICAAQNQRIEDLKFRVTLTHKSILTILLPCCYNGGIGE